LCVLDFGVLFKIVLCGVVLVCGLCCLFVFDLLLLICLWICLWDYYGCLFVALVLVIAFDGWVFVWYCLRLI